MRFRRSGGVAALALALTTSPVMTPPASAAPPALSMSTPIAGPSTNPLPTFSGSTDCTNGACSEITVNIYSGSVPVGLPVRTLTAAKSVAWSIDPGTPLPDGTYSVTASQSRQGGNGGLAVTSPRTFVVDTTGPIITFSPAIASSVVEGSTTTFAYSLTDAGVGTIASVVVGCGAGTSSNASNTNTSGSFDCHFEDGPGTGSVVAQATDALGNQGAPSSEAVSVLNEAPSVAITSGDTEVLDGASSTFTYTIADPGTDTISSVSVSCGNGVLSNATNDEISGSFDCLFPTVGSSLVSVAASDSDGDAGAPASVDVTVAQRNRPPTADQVAGATTAYVADAKAYSVTADDPDGDALSYAWSIVSGAAMFDGPSTTSDVRVAFLAPGTVEVAVEVTDNNGHTVTRNLSVDVATPPLPEPEPTVEPTTEPTVEPTTEPTVEPTTEPTTEPTVEPTIEPTPDPDPVSTSPAPELPPGPHSNPPPQDSGSGGGAGPGLPPADEPAIDGDAAPVAVGGADMEAISPNSDGRMDEVKVVVSFSEVVQWSFDLLGPRGDVVHSSDRGRVFVTKWDGTVDGIPVPDGTYLWRLTGRDMSGNPIEPVSDEILVDRTAPEIRRVRVVGVDTKRPTARGQVAVAVDEGSDVQVMLVGRSSTYTLAAMRCQPGKDVVARWTGRDVLGHRIPRGTYRVAAVATDAAWNQAMFQGRRLRITR